MKRTVAALIGAALMAALPLTSSTAAPITHRVEVTAGQLKTWQGTAAVGANVNYNGLIDEGTERQCSTDAQTLCEYTLVTLHNPVPLDDLDGKVRKSVSITLDAFTLPSPASDFDMVVFDTDSTGATKGNIVAESANTDVVDQDEQVNFSVETTFLSPTRYYLVEVAYFTTANAAYRGTVNFGQPVAKAIPTAQLPPIAQRGFEFTPGAVGTWNGASSTGVNLSHFSTDDDDVLPEACGKDAQNYCDYTLIKVVNPMTAEEIAAGKTKKTRSISFNLNTYSPVPGPVADFDQKIYKWDPVTNTRGDQLNTPWATAQPPDHEENYNTTVTTTPSVSEAWFLVEVIYFTTVNGSYIGRVTF